MKPGTRPFLTRVPFAALILLAGGAFLYFVYVVVR
ncbi:hypothetical protein FTUN_8161 [Frigoriglobus tundricola]|uniref:Uncharacterized protein n=1 Tax=Frigoriglobus tundricola TaxID=2774151 RepID=A0A6M5Z4X9_9BACT|nr:hypothetical protein FTUN_8161 [Frigoriglobus tundricola]